MPTTMQFSATIARPPTVIFDLLADISHYSRWLPTSTTYRETIVASTEPTRLGTTYSDHQNGSTMHGSVTEFAPPTNLTFNQTTTFNRLIFDGTLQIEAHYTLIPEGSSTRVTRTLTINSHGIFVLLQPYVVSITRKESQRILDKLKAYLESDTNTRS